jgi:hypothetical protein
MCCSWDDFGHLIKHWLVIQKKYSGLYQNKNENMTFKAMNVGPCHHGMARPQVADGGTASYIAVY